MIVFHTYLLFVVSFRGIICSLMSQEISFMLSMKQKKNPPEQKHFFLIASRLLYISITFLSRIYYETSTKSNAAEISITYIRLYTFCLYGWQSVFICCYCVVLLGFLLADRACQTNPKSWTIGFSHGK